MPTVGIGLSLMVRGARAGRGKVTRFRTVTAEKVNEILVREAPNSEARMQETVAAHFTTGEGSGQTARSISLEVRPGKTGASIRFRIGTFRQTRFLTSLLPESKFHANPYIIPVRNRRMLRFFWKAGPEGPGFYFRQEVAHPGFGRDIIKEAGETELANLSNLVVMEVRNVTSSIFSRESSFSEDD
jgi:hypothetical protein